ncbi:unnamed protein product [Pleuronectes platessa]|uniref:Uncharacterized protein n=1 Tax=Pleuronectes platessa TaxID=8262 RepID=A0A9N7VK12_PLEPL|nr:unnamed protein product [Pleuronectes platessa]
MPASPAGPCNITQGSRGSCAACEWSCSSGLMSSTLSNSPILCSLLVTLHYVVCFRGEAQADPGGPPLQRAENYTVHGTEETVNAGPLSWLGMEGCSDSSLEAIQVNDQWSPNYPSALIQGEASTAGGAGDCGLNWTFLPRHLPLTFPPAAEKNAELYVSPGDSLPNFYEAHIPLRYHLRIEATVTPN